MTAYFSALSHLLMPSHQVQYAYELLSHVAHVCGKCQKVERKWARGWKTNQPWQNQLINGHIWERIFYLDATMLIFFQIFPTLHISQNRFAHAYHTGTLPCCHWKQSHTSRPVNGLSHVSDPTLFVSEVANEQRRVKRKHGVQVCTSSTPVTGQLVLNYSFS